MSENEFSVNEFIVREMGYPGVIKQTVVEELVRCAGCKHRPTMPENSRGVFDLEFPDDECPCQCGDPWYNREPEDDWFCANGERREE